MQPLRFKQDGLPSEDRDRYARALRLLRARGVRGKTLRCLLCALTFEAERDCQVDAWSTVAQDRCALRAFIDAAAALREASRRLSPRANAELATACNSTFGKPIVAKEIANSMQALARACLHRVDAMLTQSRRESYPNVINVIAREIASLGIKKTARATTPFHDICKASFTLCDIVGRPLRAGIGGKRPRATAQTIDPSASIRRYMTQQVDQADGAVIS